MKFESRLGLAAILVCSATSIRGQSSPQVLFTPGVISTVTSNHDILNGLALDAQGNLYIVDSSACIVNKFNLTSKVSTVVAGSGSCSTSGDGTGDGSPATSAQLSLVKGIAVDASGNIYLSQQNVVREVSATTGSITPVAGNGTSGADSGDGGLATAATLSNPGGLAVDRSGNLFIAEAPVSLVDNLGGRVRRVDAQTKIITRVAGTGTAGFSGNNGPAVNAQLGSAAGLAVDGSRQALYIADPIDHVVWRVNLANGIINVYAGTGTQSGYSGDGGLAINAQLSQVEALALDAIGDLYLFDGPLNGPHVRVVSRSTGLIETVAGNGAQADAPNGSLASSTGFSPLFHGPDRLAVDGAGNLFIYNVQIELLPPDYHTQVYVSRIMEISQSTSFVTFPAAAPDSNKPTQTLLLWNFGAAPLTFNAPISISGSASSDFTQTDNCGTSLASGAFCSINIRFTPSALGIRSATLSVSDDAPGSPQEVPLTGNGAAEVLGINIDMPGAQSSPFVGVATFFGWAIDNVSPVSTITLSVDGFPIGPAVYGENRPDVCAAYPNQVGCPNVGWSFGLDTTRFANGTHALEATVTSATGAHRTTSASFSIANWVAGDPTRIAIDVPSPNASYAGLVAFGGWAIDPDSPISAVGISIDGVPVGPAGYGANRPDVCAVFQNPPGCPNVGWSGSVDTSLFADGPHTLAVTATPVSGASTTVTTSFLIKNNTATNPTKISIDIPGPSNQVLSGKSQVAGWAFNQTNPVAVVISVDGIGVGTASGGFARPDVCAVYSNPAGCPNIGWNYLLDTTKLANGPHVLQASAEAFGGQPANATTAVAFTVANSSSSNPTRIVIDVPGRQTVVSGTLTAGGWALNDNAAISQLTVYVDGLFYGTAQYGSSRPDVCVVYPRRPGCPDVGWSVEIDTTQLANGRHTITASASTANGQSAIVDSSFTVENWTATGNPVTLDIDVPRSPGSTLTGPSALIAGWAIDNQALITGVSISVDGVFNGSATYGANRPDVCAVFSNQPNCPNVGWNYLLNTTLLTDGMHALDITVLTSDAQSYTTTASFRVTNITPTNPILISIDIPNTGSKAFSGTAAFGGWAIDSNASISTVNVYVDGVLAGAASYGGVRADVCSAYPGRLGCPDVGWNVLLDTTAYANGPHTLEVTAVSANGQTETLGSPFAIAN